MLVASPQPHSEQNCYSCHEERVREIKASISLISAAVFLILFTLPKMPAPYSIAFSAMYGASMFFGFYEVPKSEEWRSEVQRPSRTWKHLAAGAFLWAVGCGAVSTGVKIGSFNIFFPVIGVIAPVAGWFICQSDIFCKGNYIYRAIPQHEPRVPEEDPH